MTEEDRELLCEVLKELIPSVCCIICENAEGALKLLRNTVDVPGYIFLDVFINGMDGKECLLKIRSIKTVQ
jgi:CheY-like chemotaxis protein